MTALEKWLGWFVWAAAHQTALFTTKSLGMPEINDDKNALLRLLKRAG